MAGLHQLQMPEQLALDGLNVAIFLHRARMGSLDSGHGFQEPPAMAKSCNLHAQSSLLRSAQGLYKQSDESPGATEAPPSAEVADTYRTYTQVFVLNPTEFSCCCII